MSRRRRYLAFSCLFAGLALVVWASLAAMAILYLIRLH